MIRSIKKSKTIKKCIFLSFFLLCFLFLKNKGSIVPIDMKKKYKESFGPLITPHQKTVFFSAGSVGVGYLILKFFSILAEKKEKNKKPNLIYPPKGAETPFIDSFENKVTLKSGKINNITIEYSPEIPAVDNIRRIYFLGKKTDKYNLKITLDGVNYFSHSFNHVTNMVTFKIEPAEMREAVIPREIRLEENIEKRLIIKDNSIYALHKNNNYYTEVYIGEQYRNNFIDTQRDYYAGQKLTVTSGTNSFFATLKQIGRNIKENYQYLSRNKHKIIPTALFLALPVWYFTRGDFADYKYNKDIDKLEENVKRLLNPKFKPITDAEKEVTKAIKEAFQEDYVKDIINSGRRYYHTEKNPNGISDYQYATNNNTNKRHFYNLVFEIIKNNIKEDGIIKNKESENKNIPFWTFDAKYPIEEINDSLENKSESLL
jgi:hypothetical protein